VLPPKQGGENPNTQSKTGNSARAVARQSPDAIKIAKPPVYERPCQEGRDNRESDLCAQWKAADSASEAAWWAMIATFVTALGTIGLFWQIKLTREAVQDTGKATDAMVDANKIAMLNAVRQSRPYVYPSRAWFTIDETGQPVAYIENKNFGNTPAINLRGWKHTWVECFPLHDALPEAPNDVIMSSAVVGPGQTSESVQEHGAPLNDYSITRIRDGSAALYVYGYDTYIDTFGKEHFSRFIYFARGADALERGRLSPYMSGNIIDLE
jgi:hypothetical protein